MTPTIALAFFASRQLSTLSHEPSQLILRPFPDPSLKMLKILNTKKCLKKNKKAFFFD